MVQQQLASDELLENLAHLEETRDQMRTIEQGVKEILEMWKDLNQILDVQQEQIDSIETNIVKAHTKVKTGVKHLETAEKLQKCNRKMTCCIVAILMVVALII